MLLFFPTTFPVTSLDFSGNNELKENQHTVMCVSEVLDSHNSFTATYLNSLCLWGDIQRYSLIWCFHDGGGELSTKAPIRC